MDAGERAREGEQAGPCGCGEAGVRELVDRLAAQWVRGCEKILKAGSLRSLEAKLGRLGQPNARAQFVEQLVAALLDAAADPRPDHHPDTARRDYEILEHSIQKSEAEIRKHIKIEQQLKLYLDSLEEKTEELQYRLELEEEKYLALFESFKELDETHKRMSQQLAQAEAKKAQGLYEFKSIQAASENVASRKTKLGLKNRLIMEKLQQRTRKPHQLLSITEDEVALRHDPNIDHSKHQDPNARNSIERYSKHPQKHSIKELTKSLQMKHEKSLDSYSKKIKNRTEANREGRSNSILN